MSLAYAMKAAPTITAAAATATSRPRLKSEAAPLLAPPVAEGEPADEPEVPEGACRQDVRRLNQRQRTVSGANAYRRGGRP